MPSRRSSSIWSLDSGSKTDKRRASGAPKTPPKPVEDLPKDDDDDDAPGGYVRPTIKKKDTGARRKSMVEEASERRSSVWALAMNLGAPTTPTPPEVMSPSMGSVGSVGSFTPSMVHSMSIMEGDSDEEDEDEEEDGFGGGGGGLQTPFKSPTPPPFSPPNSASFMEGLASMGLDLAQESVDDDDENGSQSSEDTAGTIEEKELIVEHFERDKEEHKDGQAGGLALVDFFKHRDDEKRWNDGAEISSWFSHKWRWFVLATVHLRFADSAAQQDYVHITMVKRTATLPLRPRAGGEGARWGYRRRCSASRVVPPLPFSPSPKLFRPSPSPFALLPPP